MDAIVLLSLPLAIVRLIEREEKPLFVGPVALILGVAFLNLGLGLALGTINLDSGMGFLRTVFYYTAYFILVSAIDSPRRLRQWIGFLFAIFFVSVVFQLFEAITGLRLTLGLSEHWLYTSDYRLLAGGYQVMYLWNRAGLLAFLVLFLGLGALFQGRQLKWFWFISALGIGSLLLAFVRQWYIYISIGILTLLMIQAKRRFKNLVLVVLIILFLLGLLMVISPVLQNAFGPSFLQAWFARFDSLIHFQTEANFILRVQIIEAQWEMFLQSPLVGYGLSPIFGEVVTSDTGISNTLVQFGLIGLGAVLVLIVSFLRHAFKLRRQVAPSVQQGYVSGLLALWVCVIAGSVFSVNYFTGKEGIWMVVIMLALLDRFHAFLPRGGCSEKNLNS
ncbi:MAG: O-antigen ligase family protein [Desulfobacteraceae bacterium]|nr:O-antigen ligase family protein [Desulfobacteraceae bacterium]